MAALQNIYRTGASLRNLNYARLSTSSYVNVPKQTIEEKLGLDPKPKKPLTPYLKFVLQVRPKVVQAQPNTKPTEIMKIIAEQWKVAEDQLKNNLKKTYEQEMQKYFEDIKEYDSKLGPEIREQVLLAKANEKLKKEKAQLKKRKELLGCPKKPPTSFLLFVKSKNSQRGDVSYKDWVAKISKEWNSFTEEQKAPFVEIHKKEYEEYIKKMAQWEKEVAVKGKGTISS